MARFARVRKAPWVCVAALRVPHPRRRQGCRRGRPWAWRVSWVTPRRVRQQRAAHQAPRPPPIPPPTTRPPLRGVFQLLAGMHRVHGRGPGQGEAVIEGLNEGQIKILRWFGEAGWRLYPIAPGEGCSMSGLYPIAPGEGCSMSFTAFKTEIYELSKAAYLHIWHTTGAYGLKTRCTHAYSRPHSPSAYHTFF